MGRRGRAAPGESRAERIIAVPTSQARKQWEEASLGRPAPWVPRDLPSWADATERPPGTLGARGWGCGLFVPQVPLWATLAQPEGPPSLQQQDEWRAGSPLSEQPSLRKSSRSTRRPLGFRRQKQKPWDGQGQTQADNEVTPFPDRNFFPKLQHCWLSASLSSCLICDPGSTLSSGTRAVPTRKLQPPLPPPAVVYSLP